MAEGLPIQPLQGQFKIADPETGLPTQEFLLYMKAMYDLLPSQEAALAAIEGAGLTPLSKRILLGDNTRFGAEIEIDADTQAILNAISDVQGSILYRGATEWASLAPGTAGQFLRTGGAGADPTWAAGGGGGGGGGWTLVGQDGSPTTGSTWTYSSPVTAVDVVGLGSWNELFVIADSISVDAGGDVRSIQASVDNGSSFFNTGYATLNSTGTTTSSNTDIWVFHNTSSTSARTLIFTINNLKGPIKMAQRQMIQEARIFNGSTSDVNAIRLLDRNNVSILGGSLYVYAR